MIVKIHTNEQRKMVLAVCDSELLGEKIEEGNKQLDLTSDFYKGKEKNDQEVADLMRNSYILNVVGEKSVNLAIKEELISGNHVDNIKGVPYAQAVLGE
jgi:hypothetical protein